MPILSPKINSLVSSSSFISAEKRCIHHGSVKDIYALENYPDILKFEFTDRYSIFDWGEMPNHLMGKGKALAEMGAHFFEILESEGIKHHYIGYDGDKGIFVKKVFVPSNQGLQNYEYYQTSPEHTLVPLECLFRMGLADGSSLKPRLGDDLNTWKAVGLNRVYNMGEKWDNGENLVLEFSTKLEKQDRLLSDTEAQTMACISAEEWIQLKILITKIAFIVQREFARIGLDLWDGKLEFAFGKKVGQSREFILVDSIGLDELRLTFENKNVSKEILRQIYRQTPWYQNINKAKLIAGDKFKSYCTQDLNSFPAPLPSKIVHSVSSLYQTTIGLLKGNAVPSQLKNPLRLLDTLKSNQNYQNILIIGCGGREHGLALSLRKNNERSNIFVMPGNPGMEVGDANIGIYSLDCAVAVENIEEWKQYFSLDAAIIGPEQYIYSGLKHDIEEIGIPCIAPSIQGSQLEQSKIFAKQFMLKHNIPTAEFREYQTIQEALLKIHELPSENSWNGYVVKLSGPALGKGVFVLDLKNEVVSLLNDLIHSPMEGQEDGVVIEEKLDGPECSLFYAVMGEDVRFLGEACDHKRLNDGDLGPNTGGMGAIAPVPWLREAERLLIETNFLKPTLLGLKKEDIHFSGFLFLGLMKDKHKGYQLLEYNVRLGDPETQTFLPLLEGDFFSFIKAWSVQDSLGFKNIALHFNRKLSSCHIVKVAQGYPGIFGTQVQRGQRIIPGHFPEARETLQKIQWIFAGVKRDDRPEATFPFLQTAGGRVLGITAVDENFSNAKKTAYEHISDWSFPGNHFRHDIGSKHISLGNNQ